MTPVIIQDELCVILAASRDIFDASLNVSSNLLRLERVNSKLSSIRWYRNEDMPNCIILEDVQMEELDSGDFRDIISVVFRDYIDQLKDGKDDVKIKYDVVSLKDVDKGADSAEIFVGEMIA